MTWRGQVWSAAKIGITLACSASVFYSTYRYYHHRRAEAPRAPIVEATSVPTSPAAPTAVPAESPSIAARRAVQAHFAAGDFQTALKLANIALGSKISAEDRKWLVQQLPALLSSAAWTKLKLGECAEAIPMFMRAETLKSTKESLKGLAYCHYKLHNMFDAAEKMRAYLLQAPHDVEMSILYVDILESEQLYADAVGILDRLMTDKETLPAQMSADDLKKKLQAMRAKSNESVRQTSLASRHFSVIFREEYAELAQEALQTLEQALDEFVFQYGFTDVTAPVEVTLYPADQFKSLTGGPAWADGVFDGRIRVPISEKKSTAFRRVLRHELVHALYALALDYRALPTWFNEGVAQRLECAPTPCSAAFANGFPAMPGAFLAKKDFESPFITLAQGRAGVAYEQSLYLIATLETLAGADFLRKINGTLAEAPTLDSDALCQRVGRTFAQVYDAAKSYWDTRTRLLNFTDPPP